MRRGRQRGEAAMQTASVSDGPRAPASGGRAEFLGVDFDLMDAAAAEAWLAARDAASPFAYVVTPNVDHVVRLEREPAEIRNAYAAADLCLCDSRILAALARRCGLWLPVVPGSDLVEALFTRIARPGDVISVIGGTPEMMARLRDRFPALILRQHVPPMGLRQNAAARQDAVAAAQQHKARFILLALGSPQQEMIAQGLAQAGATGTALCIGAGVEFIAGLQRRAPSLIQKAGLEWAWRLGSDPRRLWKRYLVEGPRIFRMTSRWSSARGRRGA